MKEVSSEKSLGFAYLNQSQEKLLKEMERNLNNEASEEIIVLAYKKKGNS